MTDTFFTHFNSEAQANPNIGRQDYDNDPLPEGEYDLVIGEAHIREYVAGEFSTKPEKVATYLDLHPEVTPGRKICLVAKVEGPTHAGRKIFWDFIMEPASDMKTLGERFTPEAQLKSSHKDLHGLTMRCGIKELRSEQDFVGQSVRVKAKLKAGKNGKAYQSWQFLMTEDKAEKPAVNSTTPVIDDTPPF